MSIRQSNNYVWSVTDLIGQGATGNVFSCQHKKDGKAFAAKVFNAMGQMRAKEVRTREIELLRKLSHKNIVTLVGEEFEMATRATVLIMELCDTSLYYLLELPENYFGLSETEFKCVLKDVAGGMKYLREHNVVHRDVKPGNILKIRSPSGGSIYKLTDFGAAKQLQNADQCFMSIYGTEEYLHPDVYEKAVMRNFSKKKFTAAVDLWSMGVTFYHAATGQLPFRPYGGRQNKETMFEIISKKGPKVISGIQKANGGQIEYDDDLPEETRVSKGLKILLRPILQELLETTGEGLENLITFDQFYRQVDDIVSRKVIEVFCTTMSSWHKVYVRTDDNLNVLPTMIASQTGVSVESQLLLFSSTEFKPSDYRSVGELPDMTRENPLIVTGGETISHSQLYQRRIPNLPKMPTTMTRPDHDTDVLKIYASVCFLYMFCAEDLYHSSRMTEIAFQTITNIFNDKLKSIDREFKQIEGMKMLTERIIFNSSKELTQIKEILHSLQVKEKSVEVPEEITSEQHVNPRSLRQVQQLLDDVKAFMSVETASYPQTQPIRSIKTWMDEIRPLVSDVNGIVTQVSKERFVAHVNLEDLIYSAKKQQIVDCLNTIRSRFNQLAEVRQDFHVKFSNWFVSLSKRFWEISKADELLKSTDVLAFKRLCAEDMDSISAEKFSLLRTLSDKILNKEAGKVGQSCSSSPGLSLMEAEVSSLEGILQDILSLVKEGDRKLISSKEIFEELSACES